MAINECWSELSKAAQGRLVIIYGEAGSGKTSLALSLVKAIGDKKMGYINTEGEINAIRLHHILREEGYIYADVKSLLEQLRALIELSKLEIDIIVIDSINALYRLEMAEEQERSAKLFTFILALSKSLTFNFGKTVIATSQVTIDEAIPSGHVFIRGYADLLVKIVKQRDGTRAVYVNEELFGEGGIAQEGFRWYRC